MPPPFRPPGAIGGPSTYVYSLTATRELSDVRDVTIDIERCDLEREKGLKNEYPTSD